MENGVAVERGTHRELLRAGGPYAALVRDAEGTPSPTPAEPDGLVDDGRPPAPVLALSQDDLALARDDPEDPATGIRPTPAALVDRPLVD
jgi:hypothetical protein